MYDTFRQWTIGAVALGVLALNAPSVLAQVATRNPTPPVAATAEVSEPDTYGTVGNIIYNLGADDFSVRELGWSNAYLIGLEGTITPVMAGTTLLLSAPLHLPSGALVTSITVYYYDTHPTTNPAATFVAAGTTGVFSPLQSITFPAFSGGHSSATALLSTPVQIDNATNHYSVLVNLQLSATNTFHFHALHRVRVNYRLQVSPAPGFATFADVPVGNPLHPFVEALLAAGITAGCGGGNYCPNSPVTRGQMAVFLAAALGLHFPN